MESSPPYSPCFYFNRVNLISINGKPYSWIFQPNSSEGDWIEQERKIHTDNLDLVYAFKEITVNDYNLHLINHPGHHKAELESLNILADIAARMEESDALQPTNPS